MNATQLHRWAAVVAAAALQFSTIRIADAAPPPPPPDPASEDEMDVDQLNAAAIEAFKQKEYEDAVRLFEKAYDKSPEPNYLFNIGRVYEEAGNFPKAIEYYDRFVQLPEVDLEPREIALDRLQVLRRVVEEAEAKNRKDEPKDETPKDEGKEPERKKTPPLRIAGYVLLGVGGATLIAGAGFGGAAMQREGELDELTSLEPRNNAIRKGQRNAIVADSLFIAGGVIALTGLILTLASLKKKKGGGGKRASVTPAFGPGTAGLAASGRF